MQRAVLSATVGNGCAATHPRQRTSAFNGLAVRSCGLARQVGAAAPALRALPRSASARQRTAAGAVCALPALPWVAVGAAVAGVLLGLVLATRLNRKLKQEFDPQQAHLENARLRAKVEELQQMVLKYEPLAHRSMRLRFTRGVNKAVILGLVDELLSRKDVNIWWLPDSIERIFYLNVITLMLSVLDEMVEGMSVNFAGHNVKLQLTYLDLEPAPPSKREGEDTGVALGMLLPSP
ncbi:hypothetical protein ABPG77_006450 [Micractinium sp. CCAP 211/92]